MKILLATGNPTKRERLKKLVDGLNFEFLTSDKVGEQAVFEENGATFEANAIIKAVEWSKKVDCLTIASDGRVSVPVLGPNWDALLTHRFAETAISDEGRIKALLEIMKPYQGQERYCFWSEAVAIAQNGRPLASWQFDGDEGILAESYNPATIKTGWWVASLWLYPQFNKAYWELTEAERATVNNAWTKLQKAVQSYFKSMGLG